MKLRSLVSYLRALWRLRGYKPKRVTAATLIKWAIQFPCDCLVDLFRLAANLRFISEQETIDYLVDLNGKVIRALEKDGIDIQNVIYVSTDTAGSSSGVMLNLLRDHANLEKQGANFFHSGEGIKIQQCTIQLGRGAIVYVDDFAGTGKQFIRSRGDVAEYVVGVFSEFFLLPCICEEAQTRIEAAGITALGGFIHKRSERPFLNECDFLDPERRHKLLMLSYKHWKKNAALGFGRLATNVVFYRTTPNTTPLIFRGSIGQKPLRGIVPRFDELPVPPTQDNA